MSYIKKYIVGHFLSLCIILTTFTVSAQDFGGYAAAIWMTGTQITDQFYNIHSEAKDIWSAQEHAINPNAGNWLAPSVTFTGFNFGSYIANANTFNLKGAEIKTYKESNANACSPKLTYRIYPAGNPSGAFTEIDVPFYKACDVPNSQYEDFLGPCTTGFQKWQKSDANIDLTQRNEGKYEIEVYIRIRGNNNNTTGCDQDKYINNGGSNYVASFTICPTISFAGKRENT